jgi:hypothetical protein
MTILIIIIVVTPNNRVRLHTANGLCVFGNETDTVSDAQQPHNANVHITLRESSLNYSIIVHIFLSLLSMKFVTRLMVGDFSLLKITATTQQNEWISYSNCLPYQNRKKILMRARDFWQTLKKSFRRKKMAKLKLKKFYLDVRAI